MVSHFWIFALLVPIVDLLLLVCDLHRLFFSCKSSLVYDVVWYIAKFYSAMKFSAKMVIITSTWNIFFTQITTILPLIVTTLVVLSVQFCYVYSEAIEDLPPPIPAAFVHLTVPEDAEVCTYIRFSVSKCT